MNSVIKTTAGSLPVVIKIPRVGLLVSRLITDWVSTVSTESYTFLESSLKSTKTLFLLHKILNLCLNYKL